MIELDNIQKAIAAAQEQLATLRIYGADADRVVQIFAAFQFISQQVADIKAQDQQLAKELAAEGADDAGAK